MASSSGWPAQAIKVELFDEKEEARLLLSLGTHKKNRPFRPVEAGKKLATRCEREPTEVIAKRYRLTNEMLREFLSFKNLSQKAQQILDSWEIGIDKIYHTSMLKSEKYQDELATAILEYDLRSKEVRNVVQLKNRNTSLSITDCVNIVLKSRPTIERHHLVLTEIEDSTLENIKEEAKKHNISTEQLLRTSLEKILPVNSLISLTMRGNLIILNFTEEGFQSFKAKAKELGVELDNLAETLARRTILGE